MVDSTDDTSKRLSMVVSADLDNLLTELASEARTSKTDVVRRALGVMKAYRQQRENGRGHIGFVSDPSKLDTELINLL